MLREYNIVVKNPRLVDVRVASVYPSFYKVAMSSLGYHIIYDFLNSREDTWCERFIYPYRGSFESSTPLEDFDIISFSIHYEQDYFNVLEMLYRSGIPVRKDERSNFVIAGGPTVTANPLPLADFVDLFIIGEAEAVLDDVIDTFIGLDDPKADIDEFKDIDGVYVPDNPAERVVVEDMDSACHPVRQIVSESDDPNFVPVLGRSFLLGVSRGCVRGCRFCMSGYLYRPKRETSLKRLFEVSEQGLRATGLNRISLIGAAASDYSRIDELCEGLVDMGFEVSMPSLRIESVTENLLDVLVESGLRSITLAPESTWKLRRRLNKPIRDDEIFRVTRMATEKGFNVKMYFLIGVPGETIQDLEELAKLIRGLSRLGYVKFSINPLIPKPHTPLQWEAFNFNEIKARMKFLRSRLGGLPVKMENPKLALIQHVLSTGGPEISKLIEKAWRGEATLRDWKLKAGGYRIGEELPWNKIDVGLRDDFIMEEYLKMKEDKITPYCELGYCYKCLKKPCRS
ncbi:MAG: putative oxidoreductase [Methanobacteriaceae archaeon 41_258]|nr:MAG: putative oxidoreductase [Methanobacteriaceae archaeon 41_258]